MIKETCLFRTIKEVLDQAIKCKLQSYGGQWPEMTFLIILTFETLFFSKRMSIFYGSEVCRLCVIKNTSILIFGQKMFLLLETGNTYYNNL